MKKFLPRTSKNSQGFTLIELMVVVTIIAFLAVIGVVSFTNIQAQSRDGRRRADIDAIATAMEANRDPVGNTYPAYGTSIFADGKLPADPINVSYGGVTYQYTVPSAAATTYTACARLEKANGNYSDAGTTTATGAAATYYCRKSQQ